MTSPAGTSVTLANVCVYEFERKREEEREREREREIK